MSSDTEDNNESLEATEEKAAADTPPSEEMSEDDKLAAEWEAASNADGEDKTLNQNEIDSLLGISENQSLSDGKKDLRAIFNSSIIYYERLPMLEVVFDRLARLMSTSLRNFTLDNVEVTLDGITTVRFGDYMNSVPLPAMLSVFLAEEWDNYGLMITDTSLIYSIIDVLLGGRKGNAPIRIEGRPYTTIERSLVEKMVRVVLADLCQAFEPVSNVNFRFERLETNPRFAAIARSPNAVVLVEFTIEMDERGGKIQLILPYATFEPIREQLLQNFMGEKFGRDPIWEDHLSNQILLTDVEMNAILDEFQVKLGEIMGWKPGTLIPLNVTAESAIELRTGTRSVAKAIMGQKSGNIALKINEVNFLEKGEDL